MGSSALLAAAGSEPRVVIDVLVILAFASVVTLVLSKVRLATIAGYLITGAIIGPHALGLVGEPESVRAMSRLAIIVLLFLIGMQLDMPVMKRGKAPILVVGLVSTILSVMVGWWIVLRFGLDAPRALAVAMALSMSSTAVVLKLLQQRRHLSRPYGRVCFGVLIVEGMLVVGMLAMLPVLAVWAGVGEGRAGSSRGAMSERVTSAVVGVLVVTGLIVVGRLVLPRLLWIVARGAPPEVMTVLSAAFALGAAVLTSMAGFGAELGAFLAGFLLASTPFRYQLAGQLLPMRDLAMAVFFTVVGLKLDPGVLRSDWWTVLFGVALVVLCRSSLVGLSAWAAGATGGTAVAAGLSLAHASEFSLVVISAASAEGLLNPELESRVIAVIVCTLVLAPGLSTLGRRLAAGPARRLPLAPWARRSGLRAADAAHTEADEEPRRHVIVAGFGPIGRTVADRLENEGIPCTIVELNARTVERQAGLGRRIVFGDASNRAVLESAGIHEAEAAIFAMPDGEAVLRACREARSAAPDLFIGARASYPLRREPGAHARCGLCRGGGGRDGGRDGGGGAAQAPGEASVGREPARRAGRVGAGPVSREGGGARRGGWRRARSSRWRALPGGVDGVRPSG